MVDLDEYKQKIQGAKTKILGAAEALGIEQMRARLQVLSLQQSAGDLYKDVAKAQAVNSEAKYIESTLKTVDLLIAKSDELTELLSVADGDDALINEIITESETLIKSSEEFYLTTLLSGEFDHGNAILSLHAGAGGTEAQDWVSILYRMYCMYCERHGYAVEVLDTTVGDEAGIKSITFFVRGVNAYGYLKCEKGVHRLVRISPFDSNARRHTSFASLEVMPEIISENAVAIRPDEIRVDTYRASGAGGQHINKTDSAIRITHIPTGIVVTCQNQRSQVQNRETAMTMLRGKLAELKEREAQEKAAAIKGELKKIEWGSQIRSYVFQPYTLVKDHRSSYETPDVQAVMNGGIDGFIIEYLKKSAITS